MRNIDKYEKEIKKVIKNKTSIALDKKTKEVCSCYGKSCRECWFFVDAPYGPCPSAKLAWLLEDEEYKGSILNEVEKRYLENVIRPFKDRVVSITKWCMDDSYNEECIEIDVKYHKNPKLIDTLNLPWFKSNTMYKGMKREKEYTPKDLGLFEDEICKE